MDTFSMHGLYKSVEEILEELSKHDDIWEVQQLLKVYDEAKTQCDEQRADQNYPLIVMEGLDGSGKTSMTRELAKKLKAQKWLTPPNSIRFLREYFDAKNPMLRSAYYSLGNYIAALEVSCILPDKPVIMDRFWHSTTAYGLAQNVANHPEKMKLPDPADDVYKWPSDLLKPHKVLLLSVCEEVRLERHSRRRADLVTTQEKLLKDDTKFRENVIQAYKNMRDPAVTIMNGDGSFMQTLHMLMNVVRPLLIKKFD